MSEHLDNSSGNVSIAENNSPQGSRPSGSGPSKNRNRSTRASRDKRQPDKEKANTAGKSQKSTSGKSNKSNKSNKLSKAKSEAKDFRFLEVSKLVRKHIPITINGYSVAKLLESFIELQKSNTESPKENVNTGKPKSLSKKVKETFLIEHIQNVIRKDPQQTLYLSFMMKPVDPDFPYELDSLNFSLTIPAEYPKSIKALPSIVVLNTEIPRGFSVNIERGFRCITNLARNNSPTLALVDEEIKLVDGKGLLSQVQTLNKYLEVFLRQEKSQTMKFVTFKRSPKPSAIPTPSGTPSGTPTPTPQPQRKVDLAAAALEECQRDVSETTRLKREYYIGEMTQKLNDNVKLFNCSKKEARYKVQIPIINSQNIPHLWAYGNSVVDIFLTVPSAYPDIPIRATIASNFSSNLLVAKKNALVGEGKDLIALVEEARRAEKNFNKNVIRYTSEVDEGLVQILNWVSNHLGVLIQSGVQYEKWLGQMKSLKEPDFS